MHHHSNWITPRSVVRPAKRFDAHFFITVLDEPDLFQHPSAKKSQEGQKRDVIEISADGTETTSLRVATPFDLVHDALADQFVLFPPQFYVSGAN
jgi:nucleoside diphosphate-linked moiety X motif 19, mitochondrial